MKRDNSGINPSLCLKIIFGTVFAKNAKRNVAGGIL